MNWTREQILEDVFRGTSGGCQHLEELGKEDRDMLLVYLGAREMAENGPLSILVNAVVLKRVSYPVDAVVAAGFTPYDSDKFFDKLRDLSGDSAVAIMFVLTVIGEMQSLNVVGWRKFWLGI
jgi:hypothetical protein